ncbi:hypothetical protein ACN27G_05770 [Plantactinospora sp. WMMB334]|uniref:hypothetical protein n=1 Tax=Plantactinospora sp. WMMB334 TaxID=3404119 RepID=UPI003B93A58E
MQTASPPALTVDPAAAYPELGTLRAALGARDWPTVRDGLMAVEPGSRTTLLRLAVDGYSDRHFLEGLAEAEPDEPLTAALLGDLLIRQAWEIRTSKRAQYVSRAQFDQFHEMLRRAERLLIDATARHPDNPTLWTLRLITVRGLELGHSEARRRYDRLAASDPHHVPGQRQLLQQLCPKWGGSFEAVHDFARGAMRAAPEGAHNGVLVVEAHLEHMAELDGAERRRYWTDGGVHTELREAAQRSVLHPAFRRTPGWVLVQNTFAMVFWMIDDHRTAARLLSGLGHLVSAEPWDMLGDPVAAFEKARRQAYQKAGVR